MVEIKIDRSTIRRNPNAGKTSYNIPGKPETTKVVADNNRIQEYQIYGNKEILMTDRPRIIGDIPDGNIMKSRRFPIETIHSIFPQPQFLFDYHPTELTCEYCDYKFPHTLLFDDYCEFSDTFRNNVCPNPNCQVSECCEISYEPLTSELAERIIGEKE